MAVKVVIPTGFGMLPVRVINSKQNRIQYYVGHTNFPLFEEDFYEKIANVLGVEISEVFSPYRFRISVGEAFDVYDVKMRIEKNFAEPEPPIEFPIDKELTASLREQIKELLEKHERWILFVPPNGERELSIPPDGVSYAKRKKILQEARNLAGGLLFSSDQFNQ